MEVYSIEIMWNVNFLPSQYVLHLNYIFVLLLYVCFVFIMYFLVKLFYCPFMQKTSLEHLTTANDVMPTFYVNLFLFP